MNEIRRITKMLAENKEPIFYLNRPSLHLLGVEKYVANFYSIRLLDPWGFNAQDPFVFMPKNTENLTLSHSETVSWLLANSEVQDFIAKKTPAGVRPKIVAYLHDQKSEDLCRELGYDLFAIPVELRNKLDGKLFTTKVSETAGLTNVPNIKSSFTSWDELSNLTTEAGIGTDLVLQADHGEAGLGTYFIKDRASYEKHEAEFVGKTMKIMKRVDHRSLAIDAVVLHDGIIVGPLLQDIIGPPEVAINPGSSSGLEYFYDVLPAAARKQAHEMVITYGKELQKEGYLGVFEVDLLHDVNDDSLYFGESNPRFSGCAMVSNATTASYWGLPLYALHLYAFLFQNETTNVSEFNDSWDEIPADISWSNILIRHVDREVKKIVSAPKSGVYALDESKNFVLTREARDWFGLETIDEVFFLSYRKPKDLRIYGDDIGTMIMRSQYQDHLGNLTLDAKDLVAKLHSQYELKPVSFLERAKRSLARRFSRLR